MQKFSCKWSFYTETTKIDDDMFKFMKGFSGSYSLRLKVCILYNATVAGGNFGGEFDESGAICQSFTHPNLHTYSLCDE